MPLTAADRQFVKTADRIRMCVLGLTGAVLIFLLCTPASQIHVATTILGIALCWLIWVTQRLLSLITVLDLEVNKAIETLKKTIPAEALHR